jgi:hypothetical protein
VIQERITSNGEYIRGRYNEYGLRFPGLTKSTPNPQIPIVPELNPDGPSSLLLVVMNSSTKTAFLPSISPLASLMTSVTNLPVTFNNPQSGSVVVDGKVYSTARSDVIKVGESFGTYLGVHWRKVIRATFRSANDGDPE